MENRPSRGTLVPTVDPIPVKAVSATMDAPSQSAETSDRPGRVMQFADHSTRLSIEIEPAPWISDCVQRLRHSAATGVLQLVVGDYTEPGASTKDDPCANAVRVDVDLVAGQARAISSLVGLPPIALLKGHRFSSFSCPLLPSGISPTGIDIDGIADTLRWGHPLDGRTLHKDIVIVPPHSSVTLEPDKPVTITRLPTKGTPESRDEFSLPQLLEAQIAAMLSAAARLRTADAFLSLSGGLDSRVALVALLSQGHSVPCVSMAGSPYSLDARIARQFCTALGLPHQVVDFGNDYINRLP